MITAAERERRACRAPGARRGGWRGTGRGRRRPASFACRRGPTGAPARRGGARARLDAGAGGVGGEARGGAAGGLHGHVVRLPIEQRLVPRLVRLAEQRAVGPHAAAQRYRRARLRAAAAALVPRRRRRGLSADPRSAARGLPRHDSEFRAGRQRAAHAGSAQHKHGSHHGRTAGRQERIAWQRALTRGRRRRDAPAPALRSARAAWA